MVKAEGVKAAWAAAEWAAAAECNPTHSRLPVASIAIPAIDVSNLKQGICFFADPLLFFLKMSHPSQAYTSSNNFPHIKYDWVNLPFLPSVMVCL